jgi:hypothetical protein
MKVRTLRMKDGFKEFAMFDEEGCLYTSETPQLLPTTATMEDLIKYHEMEDFETDFDKLEIVEFDLAESGVIGADIRNKLTPPKNLVSLLEVLFDNPESVDKDKIMKIIRKEMNATKKSVEYIAQLL